MAKSRAEIQKAYRERRKAASGEFLKKDRARKKATYVPTALVSVAEKKKRREIAKQGMAKLRKCRRIISRVDLGESATGNASIPTEDGPCDSTTLPETPLIIRMNFNNTSPYDGTPRTATRSRTSRAVSKARREIKRLEKENVTLQRKLWAIKKRAERQTKKSTKGRNVNNAAPTPVKKADEQLRSEGLTPRKHKKLRKSLILHHSLTQEITESTQIKGNRGKIESVVGGKIIRKTRSVSLLSKSIKLARKRLSSINSKTIKASQKKREVEKNLHLKNAVLMFLRRDDNSICLPGKRDGKKDVQKRVLTGYLYDLHAKYLAELQPKVSLSFFTKVRQQEKQYLLPVASAKRRTCLCTHHQNMSLKLCAMKKAGLQVITDANKFCKENTDAQVDALFTLDENSLIAFEVWQNEQVKHKEATIKRMTLVKKEQQMNEFKTTFIKELGDFRGHIHRVATQYNEIRYLRENLPDGHMTVQMDFAENYSCSHSSEIQSAYYSKPQVTLHPVVVHYNTTNNAITHKSFVFTSDVTTHDSAAVIAVIGMLIPELKAIDPNLSCVHYVTDSPTSQYRNKYMIKTISLHKETFGAAASWHYLEAGHGKGPCDGVGGTSKRMADMAVIQGKAVIQNALDFTQWGNGEENKSEIKYILFTDEKVKNAASTIEKMEAKTVAGTMKLHSVVPLQVGTVATRDTSCFCSRCFKDGVFLAACAGWTKHNISNNPQPADTETTDEGTGTGHEPMSLTDTGSTYYNVGDFLIANYDNFSYIGKVKDHDDNDGEICMSFMQKTSKNVQNFKWPTPPDELWMTSNDVVMKISEMVPCGKSKRVFKLSATDEQLAKSNNVIFG